jgi:outer membrane protein
MKKLSIALVLAALGVSTGAAMAAESPWLVRVRAVHINPADKSSANAGAGIPADAVTVSSKTIPEIDISYFFTPNISAELILTYPQKHDVFLGADKVGTLKHLPPTLTAQYHFMPAAQFSPYVGAGINYTLFSKTNNLVGNSMSLEHDSVGFALQAGFDYKLDKNWSLNLDIKKVQIRTDLNAGNTTVSSLKVDPVLIGVGVGYRF